MNASSTLTISITSFTIMHKMTAFIADLTIAKDVWLEIIAIVHTRLAIKFTDTCLASFSDLLTCSTEIGSDCCFDKIVTDITSSTYWSRIAILTIGHILIAWNAIFIIKGI